MNSQTRRYVFIDYENLQLVKFKKLEKVSTRIFVFVEAKEEAIPLALVQTLQRVGKNLKWVVVNTSQSGNLNYHIAFVMGKFHQKVEPDVEFAVVSNDTDYDPLVTFINSCGRSCLRVRRRRERALFKEPLTSQQNSVFDLDNMSLETVAVETKMDFLVQDEIISRTAEDTVKRLIRSGNRPTEISTLKNYIHLHNQELSLHGQINLIIDKMKETKDIEIHKEEVVYNF